MMRITLDTLTLELNETGLLTSLCAPDGTELLPGNFPAQPFLQIGLHGRMLAPTELKGDADSLRFAFENGTEVSLSCTKRDGYAVFCADKVSGEADVLEFGPIFTGMSSVIGDVIGVVQGETWALGVQALNAKTLPGFPAEFADCIHKNAAHYTISELSVAALSYHDSAAYAAEIDGKPAGMMQLYCENRLRNRVRNILNYEAVPVAPMKDCPDAHIDGAAFALFCCKKEEALDRIGRIEVGEGLPHPLLDGVWAKKSRESMRSYLITEFTPETFPKMLGWAKEAGFRNLYHAEPFTTWGNFILREDCFPKGDESLREYCEAAAKEEMKIGLHTLTSFTTTNDPYVTPVPDSRLALLGESALTADIPADAEELTAADGELYQRVTTLQTVRIGDELIRYSENENGRLTGCERGAWGTKACAHAAGEQVKLLCDHPYRVFFPNIELQDAYSERLGTLFAETGAAQTSFDGLEGCESTGEDAYAVNRFCLETWNKWNRPDAINDASRLHHNLWHMNTRMNWGEPWGAKMREGMIESRIRNQDFYRRNLFPRMLGWFLIRKADRRFEATPPEDIEWALSMAAGFDAGFALSTSAAVLDVNGCSKELFRLIRNWETLRLAGAFSDELRTRLCDPKTEWHLEKTGDGYQLFPISISRPMVCDLLELQPGQPGGADWTLTNPFEEQDYDLRIRVEGNGEIHNPAFITKRGMLRFPCTVKGGQYLWFRGGKATVTDRNYRPIQDVVPEGRGIAANGQKPFSFSCQFSGEEGPEVTVRVFTRGEPITIADPEAKI